jgi:hypothetical protein
MANIKFKSTITTENIFKNIKKHNLKTNAVVHEKCPAMLTGQFI